MPEFLQSLLDHLGFDEPWKPVSRPALSAWMVFYVAFLAYAFSAHGGFLIIDSANLVVHEGGHNLFSWFGPTLCLWGGTLLQWLVPFLLAVYFFTQRETTGFVFCLFFFFENWLYTATYMADARAMALPLVTTGDPDFVEHDFNGIFSSVGVLAYDTRIAAVVRLLGWCGMLAVVGWFAVTALKSRPRESPAPGWKSVVSLRAVIESPNSSYASPASKSGVRDSGNGGWNLRSRLNHRRTLPETACAKARCD
jgi:hypothetical protein